MPMQFWPQVTGAGLVVRELPIRLVYNDPNRHFGGELDDPTIRHQHYVDVFETEMNRIAKKAKSNRGEEPKVSCGSNFRSQPGLKPQGCSPCGTR